MKQIRRRTAAADIEAISASLGTVDSPGYECGIFF